MPDPVKPATVTQPDKLPTNKLLATAIVSVIVAWAQTGLGDLANLVPWTAPYAEALRPFTSTIIGGVFAYFFVKDRPNA